VARVVFLIIDALPPRHVTPMLMPALSALGDEGGRSIGRAVMTSATYPNHATFATGVDPLVHGLIANWIVVDGQPRPAQAIGPSVPTTSTPAERRDARRARSSAIKTSST
jgi:hypothetical protein